MSMLQSSVIYLNVARVKLSNVVNLWKFSSFCAKCVSFIWRGFWFKKWKKPLSSGNAFRAVMWDKKRPKPKRPNSLNFVLATRISLKHVISVTLITLLRHLSWRLTDGIFLINDVHEDVHKGNELRSGN